MRALVIDDSRVMRSLLSRELRRLDFEVLEADNGQSALEVLEACEADGTLPELATIDWNMPVMDGLSFVQSVRRRREWRQLTMMMVTTESEHGQIVRALAAGAHEYLMKPFPPEALEQKLELLGLFPTRSLA